MAIPTKEKEEKILKKKDADRGRSIAGAKPLLRSLSGFTHGCNTFIALVTSLILLPHGLFMGAEVEDNSDFVRKLTAVCMITNFVGMLRLRFSWLWAQVQNFQLSKTPIEKKGLTANSVRDFNKARAYSLIFQGTVPMLFLVKGVWGVDIPYLKVQVPVILLGIFLILLTLYKARDYYFNLHGHPFNFALLSPLVIIIPSIYGLRELISWTWTFGILGLDVNDLHYQYPHLWVYVVRNAVLHIAFIQYGFLFYYLNSRDIVTVDTVRHFVLVFHPVVMWLKIMSMLYTIQPFREVPVSFVACFIPAGEILYTLGMAKNGFFKTYPAVLQRFSKICLGMAEKVE